MNIPQQYLETFKSTVTNAFSFLVTDFDLQYVGLNTVDDDPCDSYVVAKYRQNEFRIDIAWNPYAMSLSVLIRLDNNELGRRERYLYLEPFIEFTSGGEISPIVPQIYPGMSIGKIEKAMKRRADLFARGVGESLCGVAKRLQSHLLSIRSCSATTVRDYQTWYQSPERSS